MRYSKLARFLVNFLLLIICLVSIFFLEVLCFAKYLSFKFDGYTAQLSILWDCIIVCYAIFVVLLHYFTFDRRKNVAIYQWITLHFGSLMVIFMLFIFPNLLGKIEIQDAIGLIIAQIMILVSRITAVVKYQKKKL